MRRIIIIASTFVAGAFAIPAQAVTLYDNITNTTSSGVSSLLASSQGGAAPLGDSFSTGAQPVVISGVNLLMSAINPADGYGSPVALFASSSSSPPGPNGGLLTISELLDSALSTTLGVVTIPFTPWTLAANTRYWIVIFPGFGPFGPSSAQWSYSPDTSGPGVAGEYWVNAPGGPLSIHTNASGPPYQMQIIGTPVVPLPAALPLFAGGLAMITWMARRRKIAA